MITYKYGDIFEGDEDILVHGCNCFNTMGSGIAKQIKEKYPEAFGVDQNTIRGDRTKLGSYSYYDAPDRKIINLYTQYTYSRTEVVVDYDAIRRGMLLLCSYYPHQCSIAMPQIGCGLAGGDWNVVEGILNDVFKDREIVVYIFGKGDH